jgi:aspartate/methionine/tyrosine aminotransferase
MRFAARTEWNTEENELARAHRQRVAAGAPVADLTASNPTRCGFFYSPDLLQELTRAESLIYDPQPLGLVSARRAVCQYYRGHKLELDPAQLVLTTSTSEAYSFLFRLLCDPGDELVICQPSYPLFDYLATLCDVRLKAAPLIYDHGWQIDPESIRRVITPRTRAIVVVHPNNPTGHYTKAWERAELGRICREHRLALIVDEVFLDFAWPGAAPESFAAGLEGVGVFVVSGLSKIAALPQMKAAWIVAAGKLSREAMPRLEIVADTYLSMNAPVQAALPAWLGSAGSIQEQIRTRVQANLAVLDAVLKQAPAVERLAADGGWYAMLRIPAIAPDERTCLQLLERGVWVHPGFFFGLPEAGWLVVSLLAPEAEFAQGAALLADYFAQNLG